ncbi:(2Fe-2S)-binding protein [Salipaludibacillus aurantiacus]|uniref:Ferric iron reductase protein FhuF, involved in iron transport n=1 Tax=Salipaludibacillus aurantiacus TaxID=1601833 RepID=A0A1H9U944_9BACI|nr:(2Fe-2S)-binding protein [Salipaludibacillus aurantiacus]SES06100.1 Ferric iron reductase protein FhuF, involved in iron transport [Salipaludibacillus aurantiacus]
MSLPFVQKQSEQIEATNLILPETCEAYIHKLGKAIDSPSLLVSASQFSKWYARAFACRALKLQTTDGKCIDVSLEKTIIHIDSAGDKWKQEIELLSRKPITASWDETIYKVFCDHLTPIWRTLNEITKIPMPTLWENTAVRVFSLYEKAFAKNADMKFRDQLNKDLHYLVYEASGELFGETSNPLYPFYTGDAGTRRRKTCCFYYKTGEGNYCTACPKVCEKS